MFPSSVTTIVGAILLFVFLGFFLGLLLVRAGRPFWTIWIPIYGQWLLLEISALPRWWIVLFLVPWLGPVIGTMILFRLARCFGQSTAFGFLIAILPIAGLPLLEMRNPSYQPLPRSAWPLAPIEKKLFAALLLLCVGIPVGTRLAIEMHIAKIHNSMEALASTQTLEQRWNAALNAQAPDLPQRLIDDMQSEDVDTRVAALAAVGRYPTFKVGPILMPSLKTCFKDQNEKVRAAAAGAIAHFPDLAAADLPLLLEGAKDQNVWVRRTFLSLMCWPPHAKEKTDLLIQALSDPDPTCRAEAARSLNTIGTENIGVENAARAMSALTLLTLDPDPTVQNAARNTLQRLTPR